MITTDTVIFELRQAASMAAANYKIWWVYKSSDTRPKYAKTMNRYPEFFFGAIHAHFVAMIMALYRIFETRENTHNFGQLLKLLKSEYNASDAEIEEFSSRYRALKPIWLKVAKLRNSAFGHRNSSSTIKDIFEEVAISPHEFRDFIVGTQELLNEMSHKYLLSVHAFNSNAGQEAIDLLEMLKKAHGDGA